MPRLAVDIDLTYIPASSNRDMDLGNIRSAIDRIKERLKKQIPAIRFSDSVRTEEELKLICSIPDAMVKIEVNQINLGLVAKPELMMLCDKAQETKEGLSSFFCVEQATRELLIKTINDSLTEEDKEFLLAFTKGEPEIS